MYKAQLLWPVGTVGTVPSLVGTVPRYYFN